VSINFVDQANAANHYTMPPPAVKDPTFIYRHYTTG